VAFYKKLLVPLVGSKLTKEQENQLKTIGNLTPGDFRVVLNKYRFTNRGAASHKGLIEALRDEARVKQLHAGLKAVGF
jgi:transitional endoplasmic reticulum ATPase